MSQQKNESPRSLRTSLKSCFSPKNATPFAYRPLQQDEVRFLQLDGSSRKLRCSVVTDRLAAAAGSFTAISYVWSQDPRPTSINCEGKALAIRENLYDALCSIQRRGQSSRVWADAICINQGDDQEKARQLRLMGSIYGSAAQVVIWLGNDERIALKAFDTVRKFAGIIYAQHRMKPDSLKNMDYLKPLVKDVHVRFFPPNNSRAWEPLAWLYTQPWFERVWVIQEVSTNCNIEVLCGRHSIDWPRVALVATWLEAHDEYFARAPSAFTDLRGIYNASLMYEKDRYNNSSKPWLRLLDEARTFAATDARDNVFGLLAHPAIDWGRDVGTQGLKADYSRSVAEVFADVTVRYIQQSGTLDILGHIDHGRRLPEPLQMASWIPRFDKQGWALSLAFVPKMQLDAGSGTAPVISRDSSPPNTLALRGASCGHTTSVSDTATFDMTEESPGDPIVNFWLANVHHEQRYPAGGSPETAMGMTLSAGGNTSRSGLPDARFGADFAAMLLTRLRRAERFYARGSQAQRKIATSLHRLQRAATGGSMNRYVDFVGEVCYYRRLCVTSEGYFGLGPQAMQPNDRVCVLYGGDSAFVIRAKGREWLLVGEMYVHGLMSGEAVIAAQEGRRKEENFVFV